MDNNKGVSQGKGKQEKPGKGDKQSTPGKSKAPADKNKTALKEFVIEKDNIQLDLSTMKYILDPYRDEEKVENQPEAIIEELQTTYKQKMSKWTGIRGSEEIPNVKAMQTLLQTSPSFLFCGFERFLGTIPAFTILPLNLSECVFVFLLDLVRTSNSNQRQGKLDALKSPTDLTFESSVHTAMVLSLCGVSTVALNQWHTQWSHNKERVKQVFSGFYDNSMTVAQAIRCLHKLPKEDLSTTATATLKVVEEDNEKGKQGKKRKKSSENVSKSSTNTRGGSASKSNRGETEPPSTVGDNSINGDETIDDQQEEPIKMCYEDYNLVVYGLPCFTATN